MQLRWYQREAVDSIFAYFQAGKTGNPLVALPTATGKSVVIATLIHEAMTYWPSTRVLMLTHVKELIEQNHKKMKSIWPSAPVGIYSAGIGRKDIRKPITFGGIQSVNNKTEAFGHIDLVIIDEAHLVSPEEETRYQQCIAKLKAINPYVRVIGFTATWWRRKQGALTNAGLFTEICYDRTKPDDFRRFIAEGFLSPLIVPAHLKTKLDVSEVQITAGEYNAKQLEEAVDNPTITQAALREACHYGQDRRSWLAFCSGIAHAEHCAALLNSWGIRTCTVHSKMSKSERDDNIADWYAGKYRCMTNNNVLTTGIDHPALDMIIMLRPTMSSLLWVQMLGRGMRVSPSTGKVNCGVLDFAGNTMRNGPVDDPNIPGRPRPGGGGDAPVKICDHCGNYCHTSVRYCDVCGQEFPKQEKLVNQHSQQAVLSFDQPIVETFNVTSCTYADWLSKAGNRCLKCTYFSGIRAFSEYIQIESDKAFAKHHAHNWWKQRHFVEPPATMNEALARTSELRVPRAIRVHVNKTHNGKPAPDILGYEW